MSVRIAILGPQSDRRERFVQSIADQTKVDNDKPMNTLLFSGTLSNLLDCLCYSH